MSDWPKLQKSSLASIWSDPWAGVVKFQEEFSILKLLKLSICKILASNLFRFRIIVYLNDLSLENQAWSAYGVILELIDSNSMVDFSWNQSRFNLKGSIWQISIVKSLTWRIFLWSQEDSILKTKMSDFEYFGQFWSGMPNLTNCVLFTLSVKT